MKDVQLTINLENLLSNELTAEEYLILCLIDSEERALFDTYTSNYPDFYDKLLTILKNNGYILEKEDFFKTTREAKKVIGEIDLLVTKKAIKESSEGLNLVNFIQEYRNIFPKGTINGYPARGDKRGCMKKMKMFFKNYPEYDQETILKATNYYVNMKKSEGYKYMHQAHYFIEKNGSSTLAAMCEELCDNSLIDKSSNNTIDL